MNKNSSVPDTNQYDEAQFIEDFENGDVSFKSVLTPERKAEIEAMAQNSMNEERERISLRIPKSNLTLVKSLAMQEGVPYQTLINLYLQDCVNNHRKPDLSWRSPPSSRT